MDGRPFDLDTCDRVVILGGGNAAGYAAAAGYDVLEDRIDAGVVVTDNPVNARPVDVLEVDHPVPSQRAAGNTGTLLDVADDLGEGNLAIGVITGGGSALRPAPADTVSLDDL